MKTRTDVINHLIEINGYKKYLEIGVRNLEENFTQITAKHKIGVDVDPKSFATFIETSDEFFSKNKEWFDIIFVDGLHEADQAYRDIENSLNVLSDRGAVVVHDCLPESEIMQLLPQQVSAWTGDVWKAFVRLRENWTNLKMRVIDIDYGVGIITISSGMHFFTPGSVLTYDNFRKYRNEWLNVISVDEFLKEE